MVRPNHSRPAGADIHARWETHPRSGRIETTSSHGRRRPQEDDQDQRDVRGLRSDRRRQRDPARRGDRLAHHHRPRTASSRRRPSDRQGPRQPGRLRDDGVGTEDSQAQEGPSHHSGGRDRPGGGRPQGRPHQCFRPRARCGHRHRRHHPRGPSGRDQERFARRHRKGPLHHHHRCRGQGRHRSASGDPLAAESRPRVPRCPTSWKWATVATPTPRPSASARPASPAPW